MLNVEKEGKGLVVPGTRKVQGRVSRLGKQTGLNKLLYQVMKGEIYC